MPKRYQRFTLIGIQSALLILCGVVMFGGHYPPAIAQQPRPAIVPVLTVEDALQDKSISDINTHLQATDDRVQRQWTTVNANTAEIAGMKGEERGFGTLLTLLVSAGLVIQIKGRAKA